MLRLEKSGVTPDETNPLSYRPNVNALASPDDDEEEEEPGKEAKKGSDEEEGEETVKLYRPPKLIESEYNEMMSRKEKAQNLAERQFRRASRSNIMKAIQEQYSDAPNEIPMVGTDIVQGEVDNKEVRKYEEENFVRTQETIRSENKPIQFVNELKNFGNYASLSMFEKGRESNSDAEESDDAGNDDFAEDRAGKRGRDSLATKRRGGKVGDTKRQPKRRRQ